MFATFMAVYCCSACESQRSTCSIKSQIDFLSILIFQIAQIRFSRATGARQEMISPMLNIALHVPKGSDEFRDFALRVTEIKMICGRTWTATVSKKRSESNPKTKLNLCCRYLGWENLRTQFAYTQQTRFRLVSTASGMKMTNKLN